MTAIVLAGCGDEFGAAAGTTTIASGSAAVGRAKPIVIKTRMHLRTGTILDGSTIGDSPFCPGGTVENRHGVPKIGLVDARITCPDGTLRIGFDPEVRVGDRQRGPWRIISGTGAYDGWDGRGLMVMEYDASDDRQHSTKGRETYTGTVGR